MNEVDAIVSGFWSPRVAVLQPYMPGEQPRIENLVKLNTNENPYPPSPLAIDPIQQASESGLERAGPDRAVFGVVTVPKLVSRHTNEHSIALALRASAQIA